MPAYKGDRRVYLPVTESILRALYQLTNGHPAGFHTFNIFVHTATSILVMFLLLQLGLKQNGALFTGLLFLIHPIHVESVAWVSGLKDPLAAFWLFLALLIYTDNQRSRKQQISLSFGCFFIACLCKGTSIVFLPLAFIIDRYQGKRSIKQSFSYLALHTLLALASVSFTMIVASKNAVIKELSPTSPVNFYTMVDTIRLYLINLVYPLELNARYIPDTIESWNDWRFIGSSVLLIVLIGVSIRLRKQLPAALLFFGWFIGSLAPVLNIVPISTQMADRYLYLSVFAFGMLLVALANWGQERFSSLKKKYVKAIGILVIAIYGLIAFMRVDVWKSDLALWHDSLQKTPNNPIAMNNWGNALSEDGKLKEAAKVYKRLTEIAPWKENAWNNLGRTYVVRYYDAINDNPSAADPRELEWARQALEKAVELDPLYAKAYNNLALAYWGLAVQYNDTAKLNQAAAAFRKSIEIDPTTLRLGKTSPSSTSATASSKTLAIAWVIEYWGCYGPAVVFLLYDCCHDLGAAACGPSSDWHWRRVSSYFCSDDCWCSELPCCPYGVLAGHLCTQVQKPAAAFARLHIV